MRNLGDIAAAAKANGVDLRKLDIRIRALEAELHDLRAWRDRWAPVVAAAVEWVNTDHDELGMIEFTALVNGLCESVEIAEGTHDR